VFGRHVNPVIGRERGSDDWIITRTNGTHVTPVIGRERGSDDWIITTTNGKYQYDLSLD
jgi:ribosomal protein L27